MNVHRIKYERTGGFMGLSMQADILPSELPEEQAQPLLDLLDHMDFDGLPDQVMTDPAMPDQFTYTITVETQERERTIVVGDASAPEEMQELLRMLDSIARKKRKPS